MVRGKEFVEGDEGFVGCVWGCGWGEEALTYVRATDMRATDTRPVLCSNLIMEVAFCQTLSFNADTFDYEAVSAENGNATIIKFAVNEKLYSPGDVVVVLGGGEEITFHGIIGKIEDGYAFASDPKGSLLPAGVQ